MTTANKVLHFRDYQGSNSEPLPDAREIQSRFHGADFEVTRLCPWWVGKCPVITNAMTWVTGADAAAVYLVRGSLIAVVGRRTGRRVVWATAELGELALRKAS